MDGRKTDHVGLVLFGTDETNNELAEEPDSYQNVSVARELNTADLALIRYLQNDLPLGTKTADGIDALVVAADMLIKHTKGKKYDRKIYIFTNAKSPLNTDGLDQILKTLKDSEATVDVISFSDEENSAADENTNYLKIYKDIVDKLGGSVFPINEALSLLSHFMAKRTRVATTFRGTLELAGEAFGISVSAYSKTSEAKLPSAKKLERATGAAVERSVSYMKRDEEATLVEKEDLVKAYRYGKSLIPLHKIDEDSVKEPVERCMQIIGFVAADSIERESLMGCTLLVAPEPDSSKDSVAMSALIHALFERNQVAIVRYIRQKNANPKIGALFPHIKPNYEAFFFCPLPYSEDIRRFTFASLERVKVSKEQKEALDAFISDMDLMGAALDEDGEPMEAFKSRHVFNPAYQRLYQGIQYRVFNPEAPLPPPDANIMSYLDPLPLSVKACSDSAEKLKELFPLVTSDVVTEKHGPVKRFWGDATGAELDELLGLIESGKEKKNAEAVNVEKKVAVKIGMADPAADYQQALKEVDLNTFIDASLQLVNVMKQTVNDSVGDQFYSKALSALKLFRVESVRHSQYSQFNAFLKELKELYSDSRKRADFWKLVVSDGQTLISDKEISGSDVSEDQASQFIAGKEAAPVEAAEEDIAAMLD